jgi:hypothetical protein
VKPIEVDHLKAIAEIEFADLVLEAFIPDMNRLRIILLDGSVIDVWFSLKLSGRYSYHWERRSIDGKIYRHDNAPHRKWQSVKTFPKHFHSGDENKVTESYISENPNEALRTFLVFVRKKLLNLQN